MPKCEQGSVLMDFLLSYCALRCLRHAAKAVFCIRHLSLFLINPSGSLFSGSRLLWLSLWIPSPSPSPSLPPFLYPSIVVFQILSFSLSFSLASPSPSPSPLRPLLPSIPFRSPCPTPSLSFSLSLSLFLPFSVCPPRYYNRRAARLHMFHCYAFRCMMQF